MLHSLNALHITLILMDANEINTTSITRNI